MTNRWPILALLTVLSSACTDPLILPEEDAQRRFDVLGTATAEAECEGCVFDRVFARAKGTPRSQEATFNGHAGVAHAIEIDDLGSAGSNGFVVLNGDTLLPSPDGRGGAGVHLRFERNLPHTNALQVTLTGKPGSVLRVRVIPLGDPWAQVAAGGAVACGLKASGRLFCWGNNGGSTPGGLGIGTEGGYSPEPLEVVGPGPWSTFSTGYQGTCAINMEGRLYCWRGNYAGELGVGATRDELPWSVSPVEVAGGHTWQAVTYGTLHVCGLTTTGEAWCWGDNADGQLGDGTRMARSVPTRVLEARPFASIRAGASATCGTLSDGGELCWGSVDVVTSSMVPVTLPYAGSLHGIIPLFWAVACGSDAGGRMYCWGVDHGFGTFGTGTEGHLLEPTPLAVAGPWARIASGTTPHVCAVSDTGEAYCWGNNHSGELGDGTTTSRAVPAPVLGGRRWRHLATGLGEYGRGEGANSTCGLTTDGEIYCWGANYVGQVGTTPGAPSVAPVLVPEP